jgi:hypothetical protein
MTRLITVRKLSSGQMTCHQRTRFRTGPFYQRLDKGKSPIKASSKTWAISFTEMKVSIRTDAVMNGLTDELASKWQPEATHFPQLKGEISLQDVESTAKP